MNPFFLWLDSWPPSVDAVIFIMVMFITLRRFVGRKR
jgi:hypothetical protein